MTAPTGRDPTDDDRPTVPTHHQRLLDMCARKGIHVGSMPKRIKGKGNRS
jgi:hypothetical protein